MYSNNPSSPDEHHSSQSHSNLNAYHSHHLKKKRVGKACDSCRIKKTKCDGKKPCNKCIQDNKICVFTEKKKLKEKNYPSGYVELLETRLDLLSKSFEKIIQLARPHLKFLMDLQEKGSPQANSASVSNDSSSNDTPGSDLAPEEPVIPINKVINYLIANQGLLNNLPLEWEGGAYIAANYNESEFETASRKFASHKASLGSTSSLNNPGSFVTAAAGEPSSTNNSNETFDDSNKVSSPKQSAAIPKKADDVVTVKQEPDDFDDNSEFKFSLADQINLNDFSLGGYSTGGFVLANSALLNDGVHSNDLSDFDSDSNSIYSNQQSMSQINPPTLPTQHSTGSQPLSPTAESTSFLPPSLFSHDSPKTEFFANQNSSVSSLANKFDKQALASPTTISPSATYDSHNSQNGQQPVPIRRASSVLARTYSHSKLKNSGHVHKPTHPHSTHSRNGSLIGSNGSEILVMKPNKPTINLEDDTMYSTLPSDTVAMSDLNLMNGINDDDMLESQFNL